MSKLRKLGFFLFLLLYVNLFSQGNSPSLEKPIFPPLSRAVLKNGLPLLYQHDPSTPITVLLLTIKGGQRVEPAEKSGLAYLVTRLSLEIPDQSKVRQLMVQASQLTFSTFPDYNQIRLACLTPHFEETLSILSKIMTKPLFSGLRINRIKKNMTSAGKRILDQARLYARQEAHTLLFGATPYGNSSYGFEKTINKITKKDIEEYYHNYFNAAQMVALVISDENLSTIQPKLEKHLGKFPPGKPASYPSLNFPVPEEREIKINRQSKEILLYLAYPLPPLNPQVYTSSLLLDHLLGKGVLSRLWKLREIQRLAYNLQSEILYYQQGGILELVVETSPPKRETALKALNQEIEYLVNQPLSEEELAMTKAYTKASLLRQCQEKNTRAAYLAAFEVKGLGANFLENLFKLIEQISLEEFTQFVSEILSPANQIKIEIGPSLSPEL